MIHCLEHAALSVGNMETSLAFYRDIIGMKVVFEADFSGGGIEKITGLPGARCRVVHLELGDGMLELFQYHNPVGKGIPRGHRQCDNGFTHIGFRVTDIHRHVRQLKEQGIKLLGRLTEIRPGVRVVYFCGPDGEACEFREMLYNGER